MTRTATIRKAWVLACAGMLAATAARAQNSGGVHVDPMWLTVDTAATSAEVNLIAGLGGANAGMNFDGATNGSLTLVVPLNWHVALDFKNDDPNMPHSVVIIPAGNIPPTASRPAFVGAASPHPDQGLSTGGKATVRFDASRAGEYLISCGVSGHGMAGMWLKLEVSADARAPRFVQTEASR